MPDAPVRIVRASRASPRTPRCAGPGWYPVLSDAVNAVRPSTVEWLETAKSYASFANRAGQYDDVARFFEADTD